MNYRHAYHAGNPADCVKHALLVLLLRLMTRKDKPLFVLDTHAGIGTYDLTGSEAQRTGEWRAGIGRLLAAPPPALADYLGLVQQLGLYPGSPALIRAMLRPGDRLAVCELHPEDEAALKRRYRDDPQIHVHHRDGYEALTALLPPPERRALVLIDPPYERDDEFSRLAMSLESARRKFATGVFAAWYPVKHRAPVGNFFASLADRGIADAIAAELLWRPALDPARLNGCGLLVINSPHGFAAEATIMLAALDRAFGEPGSETSIGPISHG